MKERATAGPAGLLDAMKLFPHLGLRGAKYIAQRKAFLDLLKERLIIPVSYGSRDQAEIDEIEEQITQLLETRDWAGLARMLEAIDQGRGSTPSGIRHLEIATYYIRGHLSAFYEDPSALNYEYAFGFSAETLRDVHDACEAFPTSYALAALLARLHIDCGWAARAQTDPTEMRNHYDIARRLITRFDPVAHNSPFLAEIQYRLCIGLEDGHHRLGTAFRDWCDLDMGNLALYRLHAFYCLPDWFGSSGILQSEACAASLYSHEELGAAAYAAMMLHALKFDKSVAAQMDVDLCLQGVGDLLRQVDSNPFRVTATLRDIVDALRADYGFGNGPDPAFLRMADRFRKGLAPVLRPHLSVYCAPAWPDAHDEFLEWASCAFTAELAAGQIITIEPDGAQLITDAA